MQEGTEGAISRVNKLGKTVFEKYHDSFTAKLIDIKVTDRVYGKNWEFYFKDNEEVYKLQLGYSNSLATAFLKMLPNIDLTKEMKLSPSVKEVEGKNKSSLFVNQDGKAIKHAYTKENPNGMPDMEQIIVKGSPVWDDTKRIAFLENMVNTQIIPKLGTVATNTVGSVAGDVAPVDQLDNFVAEANESASVVDSADQPF